MASETEPESMPTPKLCLHSLPRQPPEPPGLKTPPLQTLVSIPFQWEEVPGKPRAGGWGDPSAPPKPKAARCLDLPPARLINEGKMSNSPSPTTVLDGPDSGRGVTHTLSFSFGKLSFRSPEGGMTGSKRRTGKDTDRWNFSSWRWGSFRGVEVADGGNFDFLASVVDDGNPCGESDSSNVKTPKTKRRSSFFSFSHTNKPNFLASIYESFKQAVPWRRKQERLRKPSA